MLGIIGAMDQEVNILKEKMEVKKIDKRASMEFYVGILNGKDVVPSGFDNSYNCNKAASGLTCTARVINDGWKITYY